MYKTVALIVSPVNGFFHTSLLSHRKFYLCGLTEPFEFLASSYTNSKYTNTLL